MEVPSPDQLPRLSDGLVTLRRPVLDDVPAITEACQDPETQRWTTIPVPYGEADARWFVQDYPTRGAPHQGRLAVFAITSGDDRFCGAIDLRVGDDGMGTVGYSVAPWARGRGVGRAALRLVCRWGFADLELSRIEWWAMVGNWPSRRMAERVGFTVEGTCRQRLVTRGVRYDGWVGGLLPGELR